MKKIMIMGSSGSGKSTLAKELSQLLDIEAIHLDVFFHHFNWKTLSKEEQIVVHEKILKKDSWIIEGNWSKTLDSRINDADMIIYLNFSLSKCLYRVIARYLKNRKKERVDKPLGCKEKIDLQFILYVIEYHRKKKNEIKRYLKEEIKHKKIIIINSTKEKINFINNLKMEV